MIRMTADDLRSLQHGDKVYQGNGANMRGLHYVGRMPTSEEHYLIFCDGQYLTHLYIHNDNTFNGDWFMGKYDSEFVGNYIKNWHLKRIESVESIYFDKNK